MEGRVVNCHYEYRTTERTSTEHGSQAPRNSRRSLAGRPQFRSRRAERRRGQHVELRSCGHSRRRLSTSPFSRARVLRSLTSLSILAVPALASAQARSSSDYPSVLSYRTVARRRAHVRIHHPRRAEQLPGGELGGDRRRRRGARVRHRQHPFGHAAQIDEIRRLTSKPVRWVVNSHWHPDHTLGNAEYRGVPRRDGDRHVGHSRRHPRASADVRRSDEGLRADRLGDARATRDGEDARRQRRCPTTYARLGADDARLRRVHAGGGAHDAVGADVVFDDSLTIMLGRRRVQIVRPGRGNTAGDAFLFLSGRARAPHRRSRDRALSISGHRVLRRLDPFARRARGAARDDDRAGAMATCSTTTRTSRWCAS